MTADWGGMIENSKAFQETQAYIVAEVKKGLNDTYAREMNLQKARLEKKVRQRLQQLPEYRRQYAEQALQRILRNFYGESDERIETIVDVALDAMEHDAYWAVLEKINESSFKDVSIFAESLKQFGLLELSTISAQAGHRLQFLDYLDQLIQKPTARERDAHEALKNNLWVLGRRYSVMSSNKTLRTIVESYCDTKYAGDRANKRPDLLLSQDFEDSYLLIEFKSPSHDITRDDIAQAEKYRDDLSSRLSTTKTINIIMTGKGRAATIDTKNLLPNIAIQSYASIISNARNELEWLIKSLSHL